MGEETTTALVRMLKQAGYAVDSKVFRRRSHRKSSVCRVTARDKHGHSAMAVGLDERAALLKLAEALGLISHKAKTAH